MYFYNGDDIRIEHCFSDRLLELHDRWLEGRGSPPAPIGKLLVMEHEPMVGRISLLLIPENLGW